MTDAERDRMLGEILAAITQFGAEVSELGRRVSHLENADASDAAVLLEQVREAIKRIEQRVDERLATLQVEIVESRARHSERAKFDSSHDLAQDEQIRSLLVANAAANERILQLTSELAAVKSTLTPQDHRRVGLLGAGSGAVGGAGAVLAVLELLPRAWAWVRSLFG